MKVLSKIYVVIFIFLISCSSAINDSDFVGKWSIVEYNTDNTNKGELYEVSPYALVWNDDRYYVVGFSKKYDKIVQFRVDRMYKPKVSQNDAIRRPDNFDVGEYSKQVIDMFPGIIENVILQCDNSLMKVMIDRFGEEIETQIFDSNSFILSIEISVSPTFYGWIFQFDNKVAILEPENVKNDYKTMIEKALLTQSN